MHRGSRCQHLGADILVLGSRPTHCPLEQVGRAAVLSRHIQTFTFTIVLHTGVLEACSWGFENIILEISNR